MLSDGNKSVTNSPFAKYGILEAPSTEELRNNRHDNIRVQNNFYILEKE
jgi:hypothetical protein